MQINWKVRFRNRTFWLTMIPALLLLANQVAGLLSYDISLVSAQVEQIAETILMILVLQGIVIDPTTSGINDSTRALTYEKPNKG